MFEIDVCYKFIFESMLEDDVLGYIANKVYEYTHAGIFFVSESGEILAYACSGKDQSMRSIIEGHVTYRDAKIITNDYGHPVLNAIVNYQFEPYGGNGIIRLMQFDELNKEISFQSYSPWVQKKIDILNGKIENEGILNDDEKKLFPFDKLNITQDPSDNITFEFDFTERFKNLDKVEPINRENLDEEINLSNNYDLSQYQDGNEKDNFINALSNAKNIQKDLDEQDSLLTQEIVDQVCKTLKEARLSLIPITNKTALKIAVDLANAITDEDLANVVPAVVEEFKAARDEANAVYNNASASQVEVNNAFDRLASAMQKLEFYKGNKTALIEAIEEANSKQEEDYTADSWEALQKALQEANKVLADENAMQKEVDEAINKLQEALDNLVTAVDKSLLQAFVEYVSGLDSSKYTEATWKTFETELTEANAVLKDANATQEQVDNAYNQLVKAYLDLRLIPDKSLLEDLINQAEGLNVANYTKASFDGLTKALTEAKAVFENPNATQKEVNNAKAILEKAIAGLQANPSTPSNVDSRVKTPVNNGDTTASVKTGDDVNMLGTLGLISSLGVIAFLKKKRKN